MIARVLVLMIIVSGQAFAQQETAEDKQGENDYSLLDRRIELELGSRDNPFVITPHKPTYVLPLTYNTSPNDEPFEAVEDSELDHIEIKFQISLKFSVWRNVFGNNGHLSLGYTQQSYWQAYDSEGSSPFRETNHEPEAMLSFLTDYNVLGLKGRLIRLGFVHQSNGRAGELSRSWNRIYAQLIYERGKLVLSVKPWWRLPEEDDDNSDIHEFLGYGEISGIYHLRRNTFGMMLRNNLQSDNRGAVRVDWSFPLPNERLRGYVEYFNGYGESLIDYNSSSNRLGLGFMLTDWL